MPIRAKIYIAATVLLGLAVLIGASLHPHFSEPVKFGCYLLIAVFASTLKVGLPGIEGTMSVQILFVLLCIMQLSQLETLAIGCASALVQTLWKPKSRPGFVKLVFNLAMTTNAIASTYFVYHWAAAPLGNSVPLLLVVAACTYFLSNTIPVAIVISLSEERPLGKIWKETFFWSFPYYLAGAAVIGLIHLANRFLGWQSAVLVLPVMYWLYRSYHLYLGRLDEEKKRVEIEKKQVEIEKRHVEQVSDLHMRTIEALALAIDAKDHTTHRHLHRVRTYALAVAKEMELSDQESDALRAAALLHDIGKLAVPDHIISKPGRLTPEEFEKMKIHPVVGAEILEKVAFPYPVASIVRAHHEKWDGTGYPDGLKGEEIPLCARILSAVDCLDAMASDRQYRNALPLEAAMSKVVEQSGTSFDPKVVDILQRRYLELEKIAQESLASAQEPKISGDYKVERGLRPAVGFELSTNRRRGVETDFLSSIASARHEAHTLFELSQDLGNSLSLDETMSLVAVRLRKLVPYDSFVAFVRKGNLLVPEFVSGDNFRLLSSLRIPLGEGLCGWVASNMKPIINGNPGVEPGYMPGNTVNELRSALVVPLESVSGPVGVLALYRTEQDAFTSDHLRVLQVITSKVALSIENALKYRQAETSATRDYLTGLPNARALFMHLDSEVARCKRENSTLAVMVCDLNGFKQINDKYGHLEGDKVLKVFANHLREICREYDYVARMGGDEFVIVVPRAAADAIASKGELIDALATSSGRQVCGQELLSSSAGAAFFPQDGMDAEQLLAEADRRMYAAKQAHHEDSSQQAALPLVVNAPLGTALPVNAVPITTARHPFR